MRKLITAPRTIVVNRVTAEKRVCDICQNEISYKVTKEPKHSGPPIEDNLGNAFYRVMARYAYTDENGHVSMKDNGFDTCSVDCIKEAIERITDNLGAFLSKSEDTRLDITIKKEKDD